MSAALKGLSSMATKSLLAGLREPCERACGVALQFESIGGVDAAKRVRAGEPIDLVVLAADAIDALANEGRVLAATVRPICNSSVAIAVRAGAAHPDVSSAQALREALTSVGRIGYSTGPSGVALMKLVERWGLGESLRERLVQAPAGTPVAALIADGRVELGFQQLSELKDEPGIALVGPMPPGLEIVTTFVGAVAVAAASARPEQARAVLEFMASPAADEIRLRHGMTALRSERT